MAFSIEIHFSTELTVAPRILTRHVIDGVGRAGLDALLLPGFNEGDEAEALFGIGRRAEKSLSPRGRKGVAEGREDEEEEEEHGGEEGGGD